MKVMEAIFEELAYFLYGIIYTLRCVTVTKMRAIKTSTSISKSNNQLKLSNQSTKKKVSQSDLSFKWSCKYGNQEGSITIFEHKTNVLNFCCTLRAMYYSPFQLLLVIVLYLQIYFPCHILLSPNTEFTLFTVSRYFHSLQFRQ